MIQKEIVGGDLLYHAVHGLCRTDRVTKETRAGKVATCYSLSPKTANKMKIRFTITDADMEISGFHPLVSRKEANAILAYLRAGDSAKLPAVASKRTTSPELHETWNLAQMVLSSAFDKSEAKDQRRRQALERSVKGLVGELAFVFESSLKSAATRILKSLGRPAKINPLVLTALTNAGEE